MSPQSVLVMIYHLIMIGKKNFKMVIGTSKKDGNDPPPKDNQAQGGVSLDAVTAILQAAKRGTKIQV